MTRRDTIQFTKSVADAIHGNIRLTAIEAEIISCPTFQRLHNVKQLGLANLVFPGANYSRFAHSLGACHNAGRLIDAIERNTGSRVSAQEKQACRLAALLHDIGHYPFSHATEHLLKDYYSESLLQTTKTSRRSTTGAEPPALHHELVGSRLLEYAPDLVGAFQNHGYDKENVARIFEKSNPDNRYAGLISSDLDCDRLDYLRRTAHTSGLPYGSVDIDYIIDQASIDSNGTYCFSRKALRAADHVLISRYFDYLQVPFHKTVVALEWSLVNCIQHLLDREVFDGSGNGIMKMIRTGKWRDFDDNWFMAKFSDRRETVQFARGAATKLLGAHLEAILSRKSAKVVWSNEVVCEDNAERQRVFKKKQKRLQEAVDTVSKKFQILPGYFYVWKHDLPITKAGWKYLVSPDAQGEDTIQILPSPRAREAKPLMSFEESLLRTLAKQHFEGLRAYLLNHEDKAPAIRKALAQEMKASESAD